VTGWQGGEDGDVVYWIEQGVEEAWQAFQKGTWFMQNPSTMIALVAISGFWGMT